MDNDTKITYAVIGVLIVILGALAYFLQDHVTLPQVVTDQLATTTSNLGDAKKPGTLPVKTSHATSTNATTTTTMQLPEKITSATITTNKGAIEITFATNTPETVKNFTKLALEGFYNGTRFHRVIRDFMIQGGDPLSKDIAAKNRWGTGGPGYSFADEFHADDQFNQGTLAMANSGPSTNGSQFFIVTAITGTPWLKGKHTVFGHITKGLDVALRIGDLQTDGSDKPLQEVIVEKIEIR